MPVFAIPPLILAGITFYVGIYHLTLYYRQKDHREHLTFALTCLAIGVYDVFCAGLYNSSTLVEGILWQRAQYIALGFIPLAFIWYIADYTGYTGRKILYGVSAVYGIFILIQLFDRSALTLQEVPAVKHIGLPLGLSITYNEALPGPITGIQSVAAIFVFLLMCWLILRSYRIGRHLGLIALLAAIFVFFVSAISDTLIGLGLFNFIYTMEYAYLAMMIVMTYSLTSEVVKASAMEKALRESERRYRSILNSVDEGVFVYDLSSGVILDVNDKMLEMYGYTREEANQLTIEAISINESPYTLSEGMQWMKKAASDGLQVFEWRTRDKFGRLFWAEVSVRQAVIDQQPRIVVSVRNIDGRKRIEQQRAGIYRISEISQSTTTMEEFYAKVHEVVEELLRTKNFYIALYDSVRDLIYPVYHVDEMDPPWEPRHPGKNLTSYVFRTGQPLLATPEVFDKLVNEDVVEESGSPSQDWLGVPLKTKRGVIGVMAIQTYSVHVRRDEEDLKILAFISTQVAAEIDRKRSQEQEARISLGLRAVISAADELIRCEDLDTLYRRAVEIGREKLRLERCGLYLLDPSREYMVGTYGTDHKGRTTDEHHGKISVRDHPEINVPFHKMWSVLDGQQSYWSESVPKFVGTGWTAATVIRSITQPLGILYNDSAITKSPLDETIQEVVAIYCSLLGNMIIRKRAEMALRESEDKFRSFIEQASEGFTLVDEEGNIIEWNRMDETLSGFRREEVLGKQVWEIQYQLLSPQQRTPENLERIKNINYHLLNGGELGFQPVDMRLYRQDGQEIDVQQVVFPIKSEKGYRVGSVISDISRRKQAEQDLRASEARNRALLTAIPDMIFEIGRDGTFINYVTGFGVEPLLPPEHFIGKQITDLLPPDIADQSHKAIAITLETGEVQTFEYQLSLPDGVHSYEARVAASGQDRVLAIIRDITERKRIEGALLASEERYRNFVEQSTEGIWLLEFDELIHTNLPPEEQVRLIQNHGYVAECNDALAKMYGYSLRSDLLGKRLLDLYGGEADPQNTQATLTLIKENYRSGNRETHEMDRQGNIVYFLNNAVGIIKEGYLTGIWGMQRDITPLKQIEIQREELIKELEARNTELERFTYTVSHDLKSPLITIRGFLGYLIKDAEAGNLERLQSDVDRISQATQRMQRLLDDLLELSRVGRISNPPQEVKFSSIVFEALELVQGQISGRGVRMVTSPDLPTVYGDRERLVEVIQNLVDNAVKFLGDQPEPLIEIGSSGIDSLGRAVLFVRDNGIGIEPQFHDRIFGLFNKLDVRSDGTGIGLSLVQRIIEVNGGTIWVKSEGQGKGTTFYFALPVSKGI